MSITPDVAIVADVDPGSSLGTIAAAVLRFEFSERLGPIPLTFVTIDQRQRSPRSLDWRPALGVNLGAASVVVVDHRIDVTAPDGVSPNRLIRTTVFERGVGRLLRRHVDPLAIDVRTRMLRHLGLLPPEPTELPDLRFSAIDLLAMATFWANNGAEVHDEALRDVLRHEDPSDVETEIARLGSEIAGALPGAVEAETVRLRSRLAVVGDALSAAELERARLEQECGRLQRQVDLLRDRLDTQTVRRGIASDDGATPR